jgi:hypothetical protein
MTVTVLLTPYQALYFFNAVFDFAKVTIKQSLGDCMSSKDVLNGIEAMMGELPQTSQKPYLIMSTDFVKPKKKKRKKNQKTGFILKFKKYATKVKKFLLFQKWKKGG